MRVGDRVGGDRGRARIWTAVLLLCLVGVAAAILGGGAVAAEIDSVVSQLDGSADPARLVVGVRNDADSSRNVTREVSAAIRYWNGRGAQYTTYDAQFELVPDAEDPDVIVTYSDAISCDGHSEALGCAPRLSSPPTQFSPATVRIEHNRTQNARQVYNTLVHEFGHVVGIEHCREPVWAMAQQCAATGFDDPAPALAWRDAELSVYVDDGNLTAGTRQPVLSQTADVVSAFDEGSVSGVPEGLTLTRTSRRYRADVVVDYAAPGACGTSHAACIDSSGTDVDDDGAMDFKTSGRLLIEQSDARTRGRALRWGLKELLLPDTDTEPTTDEYPRSPWRETDLAVHVDYSALPRSQRARARKQVARTLAAFETERALVPSDLNLTRVSDSWRADLLVTFVPPDDCATGAVCTESKGRTEDGEPIQTSGKIRIERGSPALRGWYLRRGLKYQLATRPRIETDARERPYAWRKDTISVYVDDRNVTRANRSETQAQVDRAISFLNDHESVPEDVAIERSAHPGTADIVVRFGTGDPCEGARRVACFDGGGSSVDGDPPVEYYTYGKIVVERIPPEQRGWYVGWGLSRQVTPDGVPETFTNPTYRGTATDWWRDE